MPALPERPLRIAVVHSFYSSKRPSGENVVVGLQVEALRRAGHTVEVFARHTDELESNRLFPVVAGLTVATGRGPSPRKDIERFGADVVHVHNLFPNFGRTWVRKLSMPLVATLHNYRPLCPDGGLFRDGGDCSLCPDSGSARHAVTYRCYKGSLAATLPVALGTHFANDPLLASATRIVTLNDDMRHRYASVGVPLDRLTTVPNFVPSSGEPGRHNGDYWLFVGRLSEEKGIARLVAGWPAGPKLKVVGSGPLEDELARTSGPNIEFLGQLPNPEVTRMLREAKGLFFPSLWGEGLPTVYLEALAAGLPVVARPESIVGTLVEVEGTGFVSGGDTPADLERAEALFPSLYAACRAQFEARYTEQAWVDTMVSLYRDIL
jgi:glycosyltransferase involved in cell wall biosynthesis